MMDKYWLRYLPVVAEDRRVIGLVAYVDIVLLLGGSGHPNAVGEVGQW